MGVHASLLPEQTLNNENIDIVVQGEEQETFLELVKALANKSNLSSVTGIWYKENGEIKNTDPRPFIDLNTQPPLSYHLVDLKKYLVKISGEGYISFETSRGCPFKCNYYYNTKVYKSTWRGLTVDETIRRIKILIKDYDIKGILFTDDNFFGIKLIATMYYPIARKRMEMLYYQFPIERKLAEWLGDYPKQE